MNVEEFLTNDLDVQKAVVESLAADKAEQDEKVELLVTENGNLKSQISNLKFENSNLKSEISNLKTEISNLKPEASNSEASNSGASNSGASNSGASNLKSEILNLKSEISKQKDKIAEMKAALENVGDVLTKNVECTMSSKIALLDRDPELDDRFPGETRDHVLEVLHEAREEAEKDGRLRRAQLLESVLVANDPVGTLAKKRTELKKLFDTNANILSGPVIEELTKRGISYKNGEDYLLPAEILKRVY